MIGTRVNGVVAAELRDIQGGPAGSGGRWGKVLGLAGKVGVAYRLSGVVVLTCLLTGRIIGPGKLGVRGNRSGTVEEEVPSIDSGRRRPSRNGRRRVVSGCTIALHITLS